MAQSSRRYYVVGDYMVGRQIGAGSFSTVWHARHRIHGTEVAIKEILTARLNPRLQESLKSEIFILKRINHPNIIRLHDMIEDSGKIYIILEYCKGGDLSMYIQQHQGRISEAGAKHFMQQLAEGLKVLRENSLIHRDLKPQNLLLSSRDDNSVLKIADFGFARSLQPRGLAETLCGSPLYMAPEIMQLQKYDAKADLWSVGAILFQLVTGKPPFTGNNQIQLLDNIMKSGELQFPPHVEGLSPACIDLCKKLLRRNPVERLTFEEFFSHPYLFEGHPDENIRSGQSERVSYQFQPTTSTEQSSQDDCLPFTLDDDTTCLDGNAFSRKPSVQPMYGFSPGPKTNPALNLVNLADSSNPRVLDSLESIDQDYVIVSGTQLGSSTSIRSSKASHSPSKSGSHNSRNMNSTSEVLPLASRAIAGVHSNTNIEDRLSIAGLSQQGSMDIAATSEQPSADSIRRISSLQRHAAAIMELVKSKLDAGKQLEAFSIQLVILAIWKQALNICYARVASAFEGSHTQETTGFNAQEPSDICAKIEKAFLHEVEVAEELAKAVDPGNLDMPEAMELIYQSALEFGRHGAVDEYMGDMENAETLYSKAVVLLQFILVEASSLILNPPFSLTNSDRYRIQSYVDTLLNRLNISRSRRIEILNSEGRSQCPS